MDWAQDIGAYVWTIFWLFALVVYLLAVFAVIADLFRDDTLNGWWKALWIIALAFVPFLTVLVYLIARGSGMRRRAERAASEAQSATDEYVRRVAGSPSPADEIAKGKALLDNGTITPDEFARLRDRVLG